MEAKEKAKTNENKTIVGGECLGLCLSTKQMLFELILNTHLKLVMSVERMTPGIG